MITVTAALLNDDLCCASVAMDSPLASPAKAEFPVCGGTAEEAGPCPRFVTSEELHILQTCLRRWRTEVEQDIKGIHCLIISFVSACCFFSDLMLLVR